MEKRAIFAYDNKTLSKLRKTDLAKKLHFKNCINFNLEIRFRA